MFYTIDTFTQQAHDRLHPNQPYSDTMHSPCGHDIATSGITENFFS